MPASSTSDLFFALTGSLRYLIKLLTGTTFDFFIYGARQMLLLSDYGLTFMKQDNQLL